MAFPPQFLNEIRARVSLEDVVGRHVKLARRGREFVGLSPFKSEKTPSFTVVPDKGFYHCFSSGEHGDVISFIMKMEGLSFPEAVERLAADAGLEVPRESPAERAAAQRRATLYDVAEAACVWFEGQLRADTAPGRAAMAYLRDRGLDQATIGRFRLGYAPDSRRALKQALTGGTITEDQLVECGLLRRPDDGGPSFDYFRGRVIFPITDRRGRVIGFGGRVMGDGQPKYLNSPDTPLFNKGRVLYGHAGARKAAHDTGRVIVTEGYMDVIGLARAGFAESVAPLGTALTESQIEELWRMAPEPILCFDGDEAGRRAAARVAERALPLLRPDRSLRFVALPAGEDPDSLTASAGARAMADLLDSARPLDDKIWEIETAGRRIDTPERIAGLEKRLEGHALAIPDRKVQFQYLQRFRQRLRERFSAPFRGARPGRREDTVLTSAGGADVLLQRQEQVLLATIIGHPWLLDDFAERFGMVNLSNPKLDKLRQEILLLSAGQSDLDSDQLKRHLMTLGSADGLDALLGPDVYVHAGFARPNARQDTVRLGFEQTLLFLSRRARQAELDEAERAFASDPSDENWARLENLKAESQYQDGDRDVLSADVQDHPDYQDMTTPGS